MLADLSHALGTSLGPLPGEKLLLTAAGKAIFTCSGPSILTAAASTDPVQSLVVAAVNAHGASTGDGTKAFVVMLAAALAEIEQQQGLLPDSRRHAWRTRLARSACWLVQEVVPRALAPRLREQARATAGADDASTLRAAALKIATTSFGGHLGTTASAALAAALVEVLLPSSPPPNANLLTLARQRAATERSGGTVIVPSGGAQPSRSRGIDGRLMPGGPASDAMPTAAKGCCVLMLGTHAASPEMATTAEARRAGVQAKVQLTTGGSGGHSAANGDAASGGISAGVVDHIHAERARWVGCLRDHGVRLLLSGAPLGALTTQLCAQAGICAVPGVDVADLRALCGAVDRSVLQEWPRAEQLRELLSERSGFVTRGCSFEVVPLGGHKHIHVWIEAAPRLSTLVVRAPSDGLAKEYALAVTRAMACMRMWLDPDEDACHSQRRRRWSDDGEQLYALPGAGACELQMEACVRGLTDGGVWPPGVAADAVGSVALSVEEIGMLRVLSAALLAIPRQLHRNAQRGSALSAFDGRWPVVLQRMRREHDVSPTCATGLVLARRAGEGAAGADEDSSASARAGLLEVGDAAREGVLEPLGVKLRVVDGMLTVLAQLLRLDTAVPARKLPQRRRRRRLDGCSSDDTDSDESQREEESSGSDDEHGQQGVLV